MDLESQAWPSKPAQPVTRYNHDHSNACIPLYSLVNPQEPAAALGTGAYSLNE
jgi:hypothetical protein